MTAADLTTPHPAADKPKMDPQPGSPPKDAFLLTLPAYYSTLVENLRTKVGYTYGDITRGLIRQSSKKKVERSGGSKESPIALQISRDGELVDTTKTCQYCVKVKKWRGTCHTERECRTKTQEQSNKNVVNWNEFTDSDGEDGVITHRLRIGMVKMNGQPQNWYEYDTGAQVHTTNEFWRLDVSSIEVVDTIITGYNGSKTIPECKGTMKFKHNNRTVILRDVYYHPSFCNLISGQKMGDHRTESKNGIMKVWVGNECVYRIERDNQGVMWIRPDDVQEARNQLQELHEEASEYKTTKHLTNTNSSRPIQVHVTRITPRGANGGYQQNIFNGQFPIYQSNHKTKVIGAYQTSWRVKPISKAKPVQHEDGSLYMAVSSLNPKRGISTRIRERGPDKHKRTRQVRKRDCTMDNRYPQWNTDTPMQQSRYCDLTNHKNGVYNLCGRSRKGKKGQTTSDRTRDNNRPPNSSHTHDKSNFAPTHGACGTQTPLCQAVEANKSWDNTSHDHIHRPQNSSQAHEESNFTPMHQACGTQMPLFQARNREGEHQNMENTAGERPDKSWNNPSHDHVHKPQNSSQTHHESNLPQTHNACGQIPLLHARDEEMEHQGVGEEGPTRHNESWGNPSHDHVHRPPESWDNPSHDHVHRPPESWGKPSHDHVHRLPNSSQTHDESNLISTHDACGQIPLFHARDGERGHQREAYAGEDGPSKNNESWDNTSHDHVHRPRNSSQTKQSNLTQTHEACGQIPLLHAGDGEREHQSVGNSGEEVDTHVHDINYRIPEGDWDNFMEMFIKEMNARELEYPMFIEGYTP